jgi:cobaltochelatase CobN
MPALRSSWSGNNPGALRGIEKLSEAVDRGMWQQPDPELISELQQVYLDIEGDVEDS